MATTMTKPRGGTERIIPGEREREEVELSCQTDFTDQESSILMTLVHQDLPADQVIPETTSPADLWLYFLSTGKGLATAERSMRRLTPLLGRILLLIRKNPHLYSQRGYETFTDFMRRGLWDILGISGAKAFECLRIAETLPFVSTLDMEQIGISKLSAVAQHVARNMTGGMPLEMTRDDANKWTLAAKNLPLKELKEQLETAEARDKGELTRVAYSLWLTEPDKTELSEFLDDPQIQAHNGTADKSVIVRNMVAECRSTWIPRVDEMNRLMAKAHRQ